MAIQNYSLRYSGSGLDILGRVILGTILLLITLGIYTPWFVTGLIRYICEHVRVENMSPDTMVSVDFNGSGVDLFGRFILWWILLYVTLGVYTPWMMNGFYRYIVENVSVKTTVAPTT